MTLEENLIVRAQMTLDILDMVKDSEKSEEKWRRTLIYSDVVSESLIEEKERLNKSTKGLKEYATHKHDCAWPEGMTDGIDLSCTCGLDKLLSETN